MSETATLPSSGYPAAPAGTETPPRELSPAASRPLSYKERAAVAQRIFQRVTFEPVGPEPADPIARKAWRLEAQTRGTLNFLGVIRTLDEHAEEQGIEAIRRFPVCPACAKDETANEAWDLVGEPPFQISVCRAHRIEHKPYFRVAVDYWHRKAAESRPALCEKSRQIMMTLCLGVGCHLWLALTRPGTLVGIQSENLTKAQKILVKIETAYRTLPRELQRLGPMSDSPKARARKVEDVIEFKHIDSRGHPAPSYIMALPCKAAAVRSYTLSALFMDEAQWWESDEDFEDSYGAAQATYKGGGRLTAISSVGHPDRFHYKLCRGLVETAA